MDVSSALIKSLVKFYPVAQIEAMWKQAADALASRSLSAITITATGFDGQTSSGIALSGPDEIANFIGACEAAIAQINGTTTTDSSNLGTGVTFGRRYLQV